VSCVEAGEGMGMARWGPAREEKNVCGPVWEEGRKKMGPTQKVSSFSDLFEIFQGTQI
jgi:hypothetical protein